MKKILAVLATLVIVLTFASCGGSKSVVGKWAFGVNTFDFKEDNTVSVSLNGALNYDGTYVVEGDKIKVTVKGLTGEVTEEFTYSLKGKTLTLTGDMTFANGIDTTIDFTKQ